MDAILAIPIVLQPLDCEGHHGGEHGKLVWETIVPFGTNGCQDGVQIWHGTFCLFIQTEASMEGPILNLDSIYNFDSTYPSQNRSPFSDGT